MVSDPDRRALSPPEFIERWRARRSRFGKSLPPNSNVSIRQPQDEEHFFCDFLPYVERKIARDGISLFGIRYWESMLSVWAGVSTRKFIVRYDPRDLSAVFVQSPDGHYWRVRYRDLGNPPITLWEHKTVRKTLLEQGRKEFDERMLFDAIEAQRVLVEDAAAKTKSARRNHQRTLEALPLNSPRPQVRVVAAKKANIPISSPVLPYEIEDWS